MATTRPEQFPHYPDGDVSIVISSTHIYQLHSAVLRRNSPYFERELQQPGANLTSKALQEGRTAYRFELVVDGGDEVGRFERRQVTESGHGPNSTQPPSASNISSSTAQHWSWLFGCFYSLQPSFHDATLTTVLHDCMGLVSVATSIQSTPRVREIVDLALLRHDKILWSSIATNPVAWTELGRRIRSPTIFTEGVVHLVGTWNRLSSTTKAEMHANVRDLVQRKAAELDRTKEAIDLRILGHYPSFLTKLASSRPGRPAYANDIYMWEALSFFRQWFVQALSENRARGAEDGGYAFYQVLAQGGQAYLTHEDFAEFWKWFPMSKKACCVLEGNTGVLKEDVKRFVAGLVQRRSRFGGGGEGGDGDEVEVKVDWLTCAVVEKEDLPWFVAKTGDDRGTEWWGGGWAGGGWNG